MVNGKKIRTNDKVPEYQCESDTESHHIVDALFSFQNETVYELLHDRILRGFEFFGAAFELHRTFVKHGNVMRDVKDGEHVVCDNQ